MRMYDLHKGTNNIGTVQGTSCGNRDFAEQDTPADGVGEEIAISLRCNHLLSSVSVMVNIKAVGTTVWVY